MIDLKKLDAIQKISKHIAGWSLVFFIALVAFSGYQLYSINRQIADKTNELDNKIKLIKEKDDELTEKEKKLDKLKKDYDILNNLYDETAAAVPEIAKETAVKVIAANPQTAQDTITVLEANPVTARILPPRIYLHIKDDSQRATAKEVVEKLKANGLIVPGIQNVGGNAPSKTELRYFNKGDQTISDVNRILGILSAENIPAEKAFTSGFETSTRIRARHYELWFGADFPPPVRPPYRLPGIEKVDKPIRVKPVQ